MKIPDGEYTIEYSSEYDNGYGIESAAEDIVIIIEGGEFMGAEAFGLHFMNEDECQWDIELTDKEAFGLVKDQLLKRGLK